MPDMSTDYLFSKEDSLFLVVATRTSGDKEAVVIRLVKAKGRHSALNKFKAAYPMDTFVNITASPTIV